MRFALRLVFIAALSLLVLQPGSQPAVAFEMKACEHCRRPWNDSPSRMRSTFDANGHDKTLYVCSPFCLCMMEKLKPHYKLVSSQIVLWEQRAEVNALMVGVESARLLINVKDKKDLSHDPDVAAFRTDKQLASGKQQLGGESITWEKLYAKCKKLAAEAEDDEADESYRRRGTRAY